jgi:hypothetical protein
MTTQQILIASSVCGYGLVVWCWFDTYSNNIMFALILALVLQVDTNEYVKMISGTFSTYHQSVMDSTFDNVIVHTRPIRKDKYGVWVYTEQGEAKNYVPYRQRVYLITQQDSVLLQRTFTIKNPQRFSILTADMFSVDDLEYKQGCDIRIYKKFHTMYMGMTDGTNCVATFRGSVYVTSTFMVLPYGVVSWERGYDNNHNQVWGSQHGYYIYERVHRKK